MKISYLAKLYLLAMISLFLGCNAGMSTSDEGPEEAAAALTEEEPEAEEESVEGAEARNADDIADRQRRERRVRLKFEMGEDLQLTDSEGEVIEVSEEGEGEGEDEAEAEEGSVDVESFTASLTEKLDSRPFKTCFKDAVEADSDLEGSFKLQLTVTEEGGMAEPAIVESTFEDEGISTCMIEAMGEWTFEGHEGEEPFTAVQTINVSTEEASRENAGEGTRERERGDQANARGNQRGNGGQRGERGNNNQQRGNSDGPPRGDSGGNSPRGNNNDNQRGNNNGNQRGNNNGSQRGNNNNNQRGNNNGNQRGNNGSQRGGR